MAHQRMALKGSCTFCRKEFGKIAMARHVAACSAGKRGKTHGFRLKIESPYAKEYWMYIEVSATASLENIDTFLRKAWLECCGHLSQFIINGIEYASDFAHDVWDSPGKHKMDVQVGQTLTPGLKFRYEYDFGSTTELVLQVIGEGQDLLSKPAIRLLALNHPLVFHCACKQPAHQIYTMAESYEEAFVCKKCSKKVKEPDMLMPIVNSPRTGICGYEGPTITI